MASLNRVQIIGNVGRSPEMQYTPNGDPVTKFSVAVNRYFGGKDGSERKSEVEWFNVVCWGKLAESTNQYLDKGKLVYIEGRQRTRHWEDKDGLRHYMTELVATHAVFLERQAAAPVQDIEQVAESDSTPDVAPNGKQAPVEEDIPQEDLPF